jgi:hypothetical protein|eukprot:2137338-Prymnesium_polylepis.1
MLYCPRRQLSSIARTDGVPPAASVSRVAWLKASGAVGVARLEDVAPATEGVGEGGVAVATVSDNVEAAAALPPASSLWAEVAASSGRAALALGTV